MLKIDYYLNLKDKLFNKKITEEEARLAVSRIFSKFYIDRLTLSAIREIEYDTKREENKYYLFKTELIQYIEYKDNEAIFNLTGQTVNDEIYFIKVHVGINEMDYSFGDNINNLLDKEGRLTIYFLGIPRIDKNIITIKVHYVNLSNNMYIE